MNALKSSIAICAYNGVRHIDALLASLVAQSTLPAELVVCDDASSDGTFARVEVFSKCAPFPVKLIQNRERVGIRANFEQAIARSTCGIIFLCDQDDVWHPHKLEQYLVKFEAGASWVTGDAVVVDAHLRPMGYTLWERVGFSEAERSNALNCEMLSVLLKHYVIAGATIAFRADLRERLLPIPETWLYDAWLAVMLSALGPCALIDSPVQLYRQHDDNAIGGRKESLLAQISSGLRVDRTAYYREELARWGDLALRLAAADVSAICSAEVERKLAHLRRRAAFPENRLTRIPHVFSEVLQGEYRRYARNWGSIALDFLVK